jgi:CRP/FNR family transcriptional regulator
VPAGTRIFDEHQPCVGFPFVLSGQVKVAKASPTDANCRCTACTPAKPASFPAPACSARPTTTPTPSPKAQLKLLVLPPALFDRLLAEPPFRQFVFGLFAERVAELMQLVEAIAFQRLDQRLAGLLLGHGQTLNTTHQQLADELGSVREIVSRLLKSFAEQGLVESGPRTHRPAGPERPATPCRRQRGLILADPHPTIASVFAEQEVRLCDPGYIQNISYHLCLLRCQKIQPERRST